MTIFFRDQITYRGPVDQVDTTALYELGTVAHGLDDTYGPVELIYLEAGAGVTEARGSVVGFGGDYATVLAVANGVYSGVAVALGAVAAGEFAWHVKRGNVATKVLASFADNANCYLTATAGSLDDAVVAGDYVYKAKSISAIDTPAAGLAVIFFNDSFTTDGLA
jgi:hypothetical protein